jgi:uncharacterized protein RhaS with RHS repeats
MEVNRDPLPQAGIGGNPEPQGSCVTYADREYVWGPDYVDECLWQVDRPGATAFVLQDANFNVVALVDPQGAMLAQYDYDPYGQPIAADNLGAFGHNRIGHQGLFADRLDGGANDAPLAVGGRGLYDNRARAYDPRIGRFLQSDPNETGRPVIGWAAFHGQALALEFGEPRLDRHYTDGLNTFGYVLANPLRDTDPLGLFTAGAGDLITGVLESLVTDYALNLEWDVGWATDWGLPDDDHSRLDNHWMFFSIGWGLYDAFWFGIPGTDICVNPLDHVAVGGRKGGGGKGARGGPPRQFRGETIYTKTGKRAHENYRLTLGPGYEFNRPIPGGKRPDAIDWNRRVVRELKPDTPSGRARGARQLAEYVRALERATGQKWTGYLDTYRPGW